MIRVSLARMPVAVAWILMSWSHMELAHISVVRMLVPCALPSYAEAIALCNFGFTSLNTCTICRNCTLMAMQHSAQFGLHSILPQFFVTAFCHSKL